MNSDGPGSVIVPVDTLDNLCSRLEIEKVDFLKIDTEGADLDVLRGASNTIAANKLGLVLAEYGFDQADKRHTLFLDMYNI